ncbi:hypothetical protein RRG08_021131 [Elysia crispata]|uniref:Uncharacterized protein n=1 Tax=Elysia crispata TaxID=231223 RepID=A0AAE0Z5W7_9GAST|nr:hypothetical protein RRG08_021131 [Elysia crispata]
MDLCPFWMGMRLKQQWLAVEAFPDRVSLNIFKDRPFVSRSRKTDLRSIYCLLWFISLPRTKLLQANTVGFNFNGCANIDQQEDWRLRLPGFLFVWVSSVYQETGVRVEISSRGRATGNHGRAPFPSFPEAFNKMATPNVRGMMIRTSCGYPFVIHAS